MKSKKQKLSKLVPSSANKTAAAERREGNHQHQPPAPGLGGAQLTRPGVKAPVARTIPAPKSDDELLESERPPEKQPLRLPGIYDPKKYPLYDVQSTIYSQLLSACTLADIFERLPGFEHRQKKLEAILKEYQETLDQVHADQSRTTE